MTIPSWPSSPTTADAATTLWTQIMLPAAPPTACRATTQVGSTSIFSATLNWKSDNIMLLIVLLPATAAPSPPTSGAHSGQAQPASVSTPRASAIGISGSSAPPPPLYRNTCTMGTVKTSATDAAPSVRTDRRQARP